MFISSCPVDGQQAEFFGNMIRKHPQLKNAVIIPWFSCGAGHHFPRSRRTGMILRGPDGAPIVRKGFDKKQAESWFPTTGEKKFGKRSKKRVDTAE